MEIANRMEKLKGQRCGREAPYRTSQLITMELEVRVCKFMLAVDVSLLDNNNNLLLGQFSLTHNMMPVTSRVNCDRILLVFATYKI